MKLFGKRIKKDSPIPEETFKSRVEEFWSWWAEHAERIRKSVDETGGASIQPEVSAAVNKLGPGFGWVFGPHPEGKGFGHSFTLSPEGIRSHLFLTSYWLKLAPQVEGWQFFSSRQASKDFAGFSLQMHEQELKVNELWLTPEIDHDHEVIHITAWTPLFKDIPENQAYQILFLLLDEALGENGVSQWLGKITIEDGKLAQSFPLSELPAQIEEAQKENGWKMLPLEETYVLYSLKNPGNEFSRHDMLSLNTSFSGLALDYLEGGGKVDNPIPNTGAAFLFIEIPIEHFPDGEQVNVRGRLEDEINEILRSNHSGRVFGGGLGRNAAYIDLIVYDGKESSNLINNFIVEKNIQGAQLVPFCER